jgi:hypothetical protein
MPGGVAGGGMNSAIESPSRFFYNVVLLEREIVSERQDSSSEAVQFAQPRATPFLLHTG